MPDRYDRRRDHGLDVVVTSVSSDARTWNLVYLQLLLEELGHRVTNLGACVTTDLLVQRCADLSPDLVVVSSVNGHGWEDGIRAIEALRADGELPSVPAVIGGKLSIDGPQGERGPARLPRSPTPPGTAAYGWYLDMVRAGIPASAGFGR
jgi:methylaspartate mutase sigma subunit